MILTLIIIWLLCDLKDDIRNSNYNAEWRYRKVMKELKEQKKAIDELPKQGKSIEVVKKTPEGTTYGVKISKYGEETKPDGTTYSGTQVTEKKPTLRKKVIYHNRVETVWSDGSTEVRKAKRQIKNGKVVIRYKDGTTEVIERWKNA